MAGQKKRVGLLLALAFALLPLYGGRAGDKKPAEKPRQFHGKVVPLADLLKKQNAKIDGDLPMLVLQGDDGKLYPLVKDIGSRMFFKDAKLHNRPMRLLAYQVPNSDLLQVISVKSIVKGTLHEPFYWCDICTIKRYEPGPCDCCGAPFEFREELWKE
jgi:hypothetical protein